MKGTSSIRIERANDDLREAVVRLLADEQLPVSDLPETLNNFFVAIDHSVVVGAIGVEFYADCGLLRSMVVKPEYRNQKIASRLVWELEAFATASGASCMYLLTETAAGYFQNKNYKLIARNEVPESLQASSEFSHVCPVSALILRKELL